MVFFSLSTNVEAQNVHFEHTTRSLRSSVILIVLMLGHIWHPSVPYRFLTEKAC